MYKATIKRSQILAALLMLTGCDALQSSVGSGPIALGPVAQQAFDDYQAREFPRYFALSEDGGAFFYTYCPANRCRRTPQSQIIRRCETYSEGVPCRIYARSGKVVWVDDT